MGSKPMLINFDGQTLFKVLQGASYTVPEFVTGTGVAALSSGLYPSTLTDTKKATVGGQLICSFSDIAGNAITEVQHKLNPLDVVAVAAVASSAVIVTVTSREGLVVFTASVPATAVAGVIGCIG